MKKIITTIIKTTRFDSDYQRILDAAILSGYTIPSSNQQIIQNKLVKDLKRGGIWDKSDSMYMFANDGGELFGMINWKDPSKHQGTIVSSLDFTPNIGFKGNGSTSYVDTNWNPSIDGINFHQDDFSTSLYVSETPTDEFTLWGSVTDDSATSTEHSIYWTSSNAQLKACTHDRGDAEPIKEPYSAITDTGLVTIDYKKDQSEKGQFFVNGEITFSGETVYKDDLANANASVFCGMFGTTPQFHCNAEIGFVFHGSSTRNEEVVKNSLINNYMNEIKNGYDPDYQRILDAAILSGYTIPSSNQQIIQNKLVKDLKLGGIWNKLDSFQLYANNGSNFFGCIDWKTPSKLAGQVNSPTFTVNEGFEGNGTNQHINTRFEIFTDRVEATDSQNMVGYYIFKNTDINAGSEEIGGTATNSGHYFSQWRNGSNISYGNATTATDTLPFPTDLGSLTFIYDGADPINQSKVFSNGVNIDESAKTLGTATSGYDYYIGAGNNSGSTSWFSTYGYGAFWFGHSLVDKQDKLSDLVNDYMNEIKNGYDPDYQRILDVAILSGYTVPTLDQQDLQNRLVLKLKSNGIWDKLDVFYNAANNGSEEFGLINWKNPSAYNLIKNGTVGWTSNLGFKGSKAGVLDTQWAPSDGVNLTLDDVCYFMKVEDHGTLSEERLYFSCIDGSNQVTMVQGSSSLNYFFVNGAPASGGPSFNDDMVGTISMLRETGVDITYVYKDGVQELSSSTALDAGLSTVTMYLLGEHDGGSTYGQSDAGFSFWGAGSSMKEKQHMLNNLMGNYMSGIKKIIL